MSLPSSFDINFDKMVIKSWLKNVNACSSANEFVMQTARNMLHSEI